MGADRRPVTAHGRMSRLGGSMEGRPARSLLVHRGSAWGLSSVGEHLLCKQGVTGSNPVASTIFLQNRPFTNGVCVSGSEVAFVP